MPIEGCFAASKRTVTNTTGTRQLEISKETLEKHQRHNQENQDNPPGIAGWCHARAASRSERGGARTGGNNNWKVLLRFRFQS